MRRIPPRLGPKRPWAASASLAAALACLAASHPSPQAAPEASAAPATAALVGQIKTEADRCRRAELARKVNESDPQFDWAAEKKLVFYAMEEIAGFCDSPEPIDEVELGRLLCGFRLIGEIGGPEQIPKLTACAKTLPFLRRSTSVHEQHYQAHETDFGATRGRIIRSSTPHEADTTYQADAAIGRILDRHPSAAPPPPLLSDARRLFLSAADGDASRCKILLDRGADPNARDGSGFTPLFGAVAAGNLDIAKLLLAKGADVNARAAGEGRGASALQVACELGDSSMAEMLLAAGASVGAPDASGTTPLMEAARADKPAIIRLLLAKGADPLARNSAGKTALDLAKEKGAGRETRKLLKEAGSSKN